MALFISGNSMGAWRVARGWTRWGKDIVHEASQRLDVRSCRLNSMKPVYGGLWSMAAVVVKKKDERW